MQNDIKLKIASHLEGLANKTIKPLYWNSGLCRELRFLKTSIRDLVDIRMWPKFSGDINYPITTGSKTPEFEYNYTIGKWKDDEYGNARRELCAWIASQLREQVLVKTWKRVVEGPKQTS